MKCLEDKLTEIEITKNFFSCDAKSLQFGGFNAKTSIITAALLMTTALQS